MDLAKQCANCGHNHYSGAEGHPTLERCPRCGFPVGYPRQALTVADADGNLTAIPIEDLKTEEQMHAEQDEAARLQAEKEAADTPEPPDTPRPPTPGSLTADELARTENEAGIPLTPGATGFEAPAQEDQAAIALPGSVNEPDAVTEA